MLDLAAEFVEQQKCYSDPAFKRELVNSLVRAHLPERAAARTAC